MFNHPLFEIRQISVSACLPTQLLVLIGPEVFSFLDEDQPAKSLTMMICPADMPAVMDPHCWLS